MIFSEIEVQRFLDRIGFAGEVAPTLGTLRSVQWAHLTHVPFENLDIRPLRLPIQLDDRALYDKIVERRRGGFCYELNGLLAAMLADIGFGVRRVSARFFSERGLSPEFDHMMLVVDVPGEDDPWLVDVGGGDTSPSFPMTLLDGFAGLDAEMRSEYRIRRNGSRWELHSRRGEESWRPYVTFAPTPYRLSDFQDRCLFQEHDPESHFTKAPLCSMNRPGGRVTIADSRLIETEGDHRSEQRFPPEELPALLREHFGIVLPLSAPATADFA